MHSLDAVPAVRRIETDRADLFAFDLVGHVSPADAENLFGLIEAAYLFHPRVDVLVRLVDYEDTDWEGLSLQTVEYGKAQALEHVRRCATIGTPDWTAGIPRIFPTLPVEIRHFDADNEREAWVWLDARAV